MKGIFRIVEGIEKESKDGLTTKYNCYNPIFTTNNYEESVKEFNRLCNEDYRDHMLLIMDFGIMSVGQWLRTNFIGTTQPFCTDVEPYIIISGYDTDYGYYDQLEKYTFYTRTEGRDMIKEKSFKSALMKFARRYKIRSDCELYVEYKFYNDAGRECTRSRMIVDTDLLLEKDDLDIEGSVMRICVKENSHRRAARTAKVAEFPARNYAKVEMIKL